MAAATLDEDSSASPHQSSTCVVGGTIWVGQHPNRRSVYLHANRHAIFILSQSPNLYIWSATASASRIFSPSPRYRWAHEERYANWRLPAHKGYLSIVWFTRYLFWSETRPLQTVHMVYGASCGPPRYTSSFANNSKLTSQYNLHPQHDC